MTHILLAHASHYPKMEPRDAVKLLYQSTFGGGHLIQDEAACLNYLLQEYAATPQRQDIPLTEDIGNGFCRVNLAALDAHSYAPEQLCRDFIRSAAIQTGTMELFCQRLAVLSELTAAGQLPFSSEALSVYLESYSREGYPPVSHSQTYRDAYRPAYRVLHTSILLRLP